ncbi:DUF6934 family protein [Chitinophaga sp. 22620]|uniref:DUF6934 family protein n=1 Tax=Chitinophaga sp. 22620 TaxID=3453952 RepID=UPI003F857301
MSISGHYEVTRVDKFENKLRFHFQSLGRRRLPKAIEFEPLSMCLTGRPVYNLGFGDSDQEDIDIEDTVVSNNGDVYRVFNTVLSTIPVFFDHHPEAAIHVRGSDGLEDYFDRCILTCEKACMMKCRKEGRRMAIYRSFVNKYHDLLVVDYVLLGGVNYHDPPSIDWEHYTPGKLYDAILVYKRT